MGELYIGSKIPSNIFLGTQEVQEIYVGTSLIWSNHKEYYLLNSGYVNDFIWYRGNTATTPTQFAMNQTGYSYRTQTNFIENPLSANNNYVKNTLYLDCGGKESDGFAMSGLFNSSVFYFSKLPFKPKFLNIECTTMTNAEQAPEQKTASVGFGVATLNNALVYGSNRAVWSQSEGIDFICSPVTTFNSSTPVVASLDVSTLMDKIQESQTGDNPYDPQLSVVINMLMNTVTQYTLNIRRVWFSNK